MQEHKYVAKKSKIFKQSFFIWLFVLIQIIANILLIPIFLKTKQYSGILFINLCLGILTIPSLYLFFNYLKYSINKIIIVRYNTINLIDTKTNCKIEINTPDIIRIELTVNKDTSRLPWLFHEYFRLTDKSNKSIVITSYIMNITDLWLDTLARRVNRDNLVTCEEIYPVIKK